MNSVPVSIDVWLWSLDLEPGEMEAVSALLSVDEEARARRGNGRSPGTRRFHDP